MPAIILVKSSDNVVPDGPGKWYAGQCVAALDGAHDCGYQEMPVNSAGVATVAILNAVDPDAIPPYTGVGLTTSGLLVRGTTNVIVQSGDVVVWQLPVDAIDGNDGYFTNYGQQQTVPGAFQHFRITDLTKEQAEQYVQPVLDNSDPENPVLISRSKYKVSQAGLDAAAANDGWLEGPWATVQSYFVEEYP